MPKVTSKLQLTVPKRIADQYGIRPGDELEWIPAGDGIRVELAHKKDQDSRRRGRKELLALFDANSKWLDELQAQQLRDAAAKGTHTTRENRGWTREELYEDRGLPRRY